MTHNLHCAGLAYIAQADLARCSFYCQFCKYSNPSAKHCYFSFHCISCRRLINILNLKQVEEACMTCTVTNLATSVVNNQPTAGLIYSMRSASLQHISCSQQTGLRSQDLSPFQASNLLKGRFCVPVVMNRGLFKWPFIRETNHPEV